MALRVATNNNYFSVDTGNPKVSYYELTSIYGHDTFLLDVINIDGAIKVSKYLFIHCIHSINIL